MKRTEPPPVLALLAIHFFFCTAAALVLGLVESLPVYRQQMAGGWMVFILRWVSFFLLGLPLLAIYSQYLTEMHVRATRQTRHQVELFNVLKELLHEKAPGLEQHSKRIAEGTLTLCETLKMPDQEIKTIVFAAMFHNIGKLFLDSKYLEARQDWSREELQSYRRYPILGQKIMEKIAEYPGADMIVRFQHENWDGSGYPDGLKGENIPVGARILRVVDEYDRARYPPRPRPPLSQAEAIEAIRARIGSVLDGRFVNAWEEALKKNQESGRPSSE